MSQSTVRRHKPGEVLPASQAWTANTPETGPEAKAFFEENGFLILRGVLDSAEIAELHAELGRLASQHATIPRIREGFQLEPNQDGSRPTPTFRKIGGINDLSEAFARLLRHPRIVDTLHEIMGPEIHLFRDVVMMKPARVGREKPWHQDSSYWPYRPMDLVSVMTALDDSTAANGAMQVIPGTHKVERKHYGQELQIDLTEDEQAQATYVPLKAGDALVFHSLLLHGSEPNRSEFDRRVCINSYKPAHLEYIGKGEEDPVYMVSKR